jgi:hypothetical protein
MWHHRGDNLEDNNYPDRPFDDVPVATHAKYRILGALFWIVIFGVALFILK